MPLYETNSQSGRISIYLKAHQLAEQDIKNYGPIERSDQQLIDRSRYHVKQIHLPTPEAVLADDTAAFLRMIEEYYPTIYRGLCVAYTGLQEPFCMESAPRYTTSVNFDGSDSSEEAFTGLVGLQACIRKEQEERRQAAQEDGEDPESYLLRRCQVTIYDAEEDALAWYRVSCRCILYNLDGDHITGECERQEINNDLLYGLGLPFGETVAFTNEKEREN